MTITVSEYDRQLALNAGVLSPDKMVTVHNGMPDVPASLRARPEGGPVRLVMVARFGAQKDHPTLLRALAELRDVAWDLDLIGEGPLMEQTRTLAASLGIAERVRFLGQRMDVDQLLAAAHISVLATNWEGFPLTIIEAMRAGLPMVASNVGGVSESVRDGETGYLVPPAHVGALRDRLRGLLLDDSLRAKMGSAGRDAYEREFTLERCVSRTLEVYSAVLKREVGGVTAGVTPERAGSSSGAAATR